MLTSARNRHIQAIRKLQGSARARREAGRFVIEGVRLVEEALAAGWRAETVLYTQGLAERGQRLVADFAAQGAELLLVAPSVMQAASDTRTPQGVLAVLPIPAAEWPPQPNFLLILDGVRDPGNLGTLLRTAWAAGVQAVILPPGGVDPFSPKVVRAGMGAHFRLPILSMGWEALGPRLAGVSLFLADSGGGQSLFEVGFEAPLGLIVGGEAEGAGDQALGLAPRRVHIPMPGGAESLNAAVAGAVLVFEVVRQRGAYLF